jgi:hypothetical protein
VTTRHVEFLVEEPSMEEFLRELLPRLLPHDRTFAIHSFRSKSDLLRKLAARLRAYSKWLPVGWRVVVMVDRDEADCIQLKREMEAIATHAGLRTRSDAPGGSWQVANRIVVQELEAWYFGDWEAVHEAYPRVSQSTPNQSRYRDPDSISHTWEAFERILKRHGYFATGLRKREAARAVAANLVPERNRSHSFQVFLDVIHEAAA